VDFTALEADIPCALFCERPGIVFAVSPERAARLFQSARELAMLAWPIGTVADHGRFRARLSGDAEATWEVAELRATASSTLSRLWNEEME
jgi:hypothetical protein